MRKSSILAAKIAGAGALALLLATSAFADSRPQDGTWRDHNRRDGNVTRTDNNSTQRDTARLQRDAANTPRDAARVQRDNGAYQRDNGAYQRDTANGTYQRDRANGAYQRDTANQRGNRGYEQNQARQDSRGNGNYQRDQANRQGSRDNGRGSYGRAEAQHAWRNNEHVQMRGHISRYEHERGGYRVWLDNGGYSYWVPERYWRPGWRIGIDIGLGGIFRDGVIYADTYDPYYDSGAYGYANDYVSGYVDRVDYRSGIVWIRDDNSGRLLTVDTRSIDPRYSRIDGRDLRPGDRVTMTGSFVHGGVFAAGRIDSIDARPY